MQKAKAWLRQNYFLAGAIVLGLIYLVTRLINLTILPVFADEAIYIYWAQLASADWGRYLFYPLNDGKTPLFIWTLIPFLQIFSDPLFASRLVSVLFGLGELLLVMKTTALFTKKKTIQLLSGLLVILAPGMILNQRLALMDVMLTFFLTASFYCSYLGLEKLAVVKTKTRQVVTYLLLAALCFGLALLTKFSAILMLPVFAGVLLFFFEKKNWRLLLLRGGALGLIALMGSAMFFCLKISPAFSQLFARGGDFLHPLTDFLANPGAIISVNAKLLTEILSNYLTSIGAVAIVILAIFVWPRERRPALLLLCGLAFMLPVLCLGKVIYSRYFLPVLPFFLISLSLSFASLEQKGWLYLKILVLILMIFSGGFFAWAADFMPERMMLLPNDRVQFFEEWSAGYGIKETVDLLKKISQTQKTLVLTEGHIGTLPDGLQIYLFHDEARNMMRIEGIGQPVKEKNLEEFRDLIEEYPQVVLVVNSHRTELNLAGDQLLAEYARPGQETPSLQVWQLK